MEKIIGIEKPTGKVRRYSLLLDSCITFILPKWDLQSKVMLNTRNIPFGLKTKGVKKRVKSFSSATSFLCGRWTEPKDSIVLPWSNTFSYSPAATVEKFWNIFICRKKNSMGPPRKGRVVFCQSSFRWIHHCLINPPE